MSGTWMRAQHMNSIIAARLYAALITCVILFQFALAAGMPWGELAWGGNHPGTLPRELRIASGTSGAVLLALAFVVLVRAGLLLQSWKHRARQLIWVAVGYSALGVVANAITPSTWERIVWLPVTILLLVASLIVARSP
jgi:predicted neutral ceramidase superfamily lipid hydrolase